MWCWRSMEKINRTDRVNNEVRDEQYPTYNTNKEG